MGKAVFYQGSAARHSGHGFNDEWTTVSFNQVITPKARIGWQGLKKHEYLRSGYSYLIGGTDFSHGTVSLDNIWYVSKDRYDMDANIQVSENECPCQRIA